MPALISPSRQTFRPNAYAKLQAAKQSAEIAIQKLRESGDQDAADVLLARYEELKERHDRLLRLHGTTWAEESPATYEEEDETATTQINIDQLEDGTFRLTFPPDASNEQARMLILTSPAFTKDDPIRNIMIVAEELIRTAMVTIGDNEQNFQECQIIYLMNMYESLNTQKERINSLENVEASSAALEIAAQLYLTDAFGYLQSAQLILQLNANDERCGGDSEKLSKLLNDVVVTVPA